MQFKSYLFILFTVTRCSPAFLPEPQIPSFLKICHRSDPELNECIKNSVESLKPYLRKGIPALHIPPCEPLRLPEITIAQASGPVSMQAKYTDIEIRGGSAFVLKSVRIDPEKDRIRLKVYVPRLQMDSNYKIEGKILMLPITGNGKASGNYTDIDILVTLLGERHVNPHTQRTHFKIREFYVDFDIGHVSIHMDNLFNGDETLSDAMNLFLNDNWKTVVAEVKPALEESLSNLIKNFSDKIYSTYSLDTLLPP